MGFCVKIFSFYFSFQPTDSDDIPIALKTTEKKFLLFTRTIKRPTHVVAPEFQKELEQNK